MLLQLAAQSHLIWELNNQPMAKRGKTIKVDQGSFRRFTLKSPEDMSPKILSCSTTLWHTYYTFLALVSFHQSLKSEMYFKYPDCFVSSSLKERGRFHIYPACFISWWLKERDILHALFIKLCFSVYYTIEFERHNWNIRATYTSEEMSFGWLDRLHLRNFVKANKRSEIVPLRTSHLKVTNTKLYLSLSPSQTAPATLD